MAEMDLTKARHRQEKKRKRREEETRKREKQRQDYTKAPFRAVQHPTLYDSHGLNGNVYNRHGQKAACAWDQIEYDRDMSPIPWADCNCAPRKGERETLRPRSPFEHSPDKKWVTAAPGMTDFGHIKASNRTLALMSREGRKRMRARLQVIEAKAARDYAAMPSSTASQRVVWSQCGADLAAIRTEIAAVDQYDVDEKEALKGVSQMAPRFNAWRSGAAASPDSSLGPVWKRGSPPYSHSQSPARSVLRPSPTRGCSGTDASELETLLSDFRLSGATNASTSAPRTPTQCKTDQLVERPCTSPAGAWRTDGRVRQREDISNIMFLSSTARACQTSWAKKQSPVSLGASNPARGGGSELRPGWISPVLNVNVRATTPL